jgi:hypothetical protein
MSDIDAIWVISDVAPDGTYVVTVQAGDDVAITLDRNRAIRYALTVIDASARAQYDAAVFAQMAGMGLDERTAVEPVIQLRADRPPLDNDATAPLRFEPIVTSRTKRPAVHVHLGGKAISEWGPVDAAGHALHVLEVAVGVDLDAAYRRILIGTIGLDDASARAAVGDIANYRAQEES